VVVSDIRRDGNTFSKEKGELISEENYFHAQKIDKEKLEFYHTIGKSTTITEENLEDYDIYEIYLKSLGPCPSAIMLSIPKAAQKSARAFLAFSGYGAHAPNIYVAKNTISCMVSLHGYWLDASSENLYNNLTRGENAIIDCYGKANGRPNSNYDDPYDCYMLYLLLRDFQALRFMHELSSGILGTKFDGILDEIYTALVRAWNGKTELSGWSMGGYQTICVSALAAKAGIPLIFVRSVIPGFCNLSGHKIDGRFNNSFGIEYDKAMTYFDAAALAEYIDSDVEIPRCGLGDYSCPATGIIAAYNAMKCKKKINIYQNATHGYVPADTYIFTLEEDAKKQ
jgi:cephalosporin-C deacetylase-like acetyl esterase